MNLIKKISFLILTMLVLGCTSDNKLLVTSQEEINLEKAKLLDFPFSEIEYLNVEITQPVIESNKEIKEGEIIITLPYAINRLVLSLKSTNIDTDKFNIYPFVGESRLFSETEFVKYEVTSINNPEKKLHYNVKVIINEDPNKNIYISNFDLFANDNSAYTDIDFRKEESPTQSTDSLLICIFPKPVDFSDLTPAIKYNGAKIEYRVNYEDFKEYPLEAGEKIDFKYPNIVDFKISNFTKSTIYRIIIDTEDPISFNESEVVVPDQQKGTTATLSRISTWTNVGNYPIQVMTANSYKDIVVPVSGLNNIFRVNLGNNGARGVNPGEEGFVSMIVRAPNITGEYKSTAVFNLTNNIDRGVVNWPLGYGGSIDIYNDLELKIVGTITE